MDMSKKFDIPVRVLEENEEPKVVETVEEKVPTIYWVIKNNRGIVWFFLGILACTILCIYVYNSKYGALAEEWVILRSAFEKVEYNNSVCKQAVADNAAQNEIIEQHLPIYLEEIGKTMQPKKQKIVTEVSKEETNN